MNHARLLQLLHYDPDTGIFRWIVKPAQRVKIGDIAGSVDAGGYIVIEITGKNYKAHRLAWFYMTGEWPSCDVDHRDGVPSNNTWTNLREAAGSVNHVNTAIYKSNTSGVKGVSWHKVSGKWVASIGHNKRSIHLGCFDNMDDAIRARYEAEKLYHGEHSRYNAYDGSALHNRGK